MEYNDTSQAAADESATVHIDEAAAIPPLTFTQAPIAGLLAGLTCVTRDRQRYWLNGVFLHRVGDQLRLAATDGHRLLITSHDVSTETDSPSWLEAGVIIPADGLKARLSLINSAFVAIGYAEGAPKIELRDPFGDAVFRLSRIDGTYPDYARIVAAQVGAFGIGDASQLRPVGFDPKYLKAVNDTASALGATAVQMYVPANAINAKGEPDDSGPTVITFAGAPNSVLYLMPTNFKTAAPMGAGASIILAPAFKASIAALRAHQTRLRKTVKGQKNAKAKAEIEAKIAAYQDRIKAVQAQGQAALPAPKAAPAPEPAEEAPSYDVADAVAEEPEPAEPVKRKARRHLNIVAGTETVN